MLWEGNDIIANLYHPPVYIYAFSRMTKLSYITPVVPIKYLTKYKVDRVVDDNTDASTRLFRPISRVFYRHEYQITTGSFPHVHEPIFVSDDDDRSDESDLEGESAE